MVPSDITEWLQGLKGGHPAAPGKIWQAYFLPLVGMARLHLRGLYAGAADEEDVALSAFDSFCTGAAEGRFPQLDDRDDLWQLLLLLTARKAANLRRHEHRQKRGGGRVVPASVLAGDSDAGDAFAEVMGREPTPELAAQAAEECRRLLDGLGEDKLRQVAVAKMEGLTNAEVAGRLGWSLATVERKLALIRRLWEEELVP